ncbi:MAG: aminopeptidase P family protein [Devosia nanyangense]|uniref:Aminopeptidase P family protein n=1 Tax=Devosia nanyangense TaxID=1228055 RepID=A0A933L3Q4_9HYPH|nr:aminopeptidase P family protein [Devosia nanyangense]
MPGFLNRRRATRLMQEQGLDALVLAQPESIVYATGAFPGVATYWRRAGAAFVLVPSDETAPLTAIVGDLQAKAFATQSGIADVRSHRIWVETDSYPTPDPTKPVRSPRPAQYDLSNSLDLLRDVLGERGLLDARIGLELGFIPAADYRTFGTIPVSWQDCTRLVERLRAIKAPLEIEHLRHAAEYASAGFTHLTQSIEVGMDATKMAEIWRRGAFAEAERLGHPAPQSAWSYIAVAGDGFAPGGAARDGDLVKIDVGCVVSGYSSDGGRTVVLGNPHPDAVRIDDALRRAFDIGFSMLEPGTPLAEIYRATAACMWDLGFETYGRGHFGHGVGASIWSEEWPFISAESDAVLEPDMVLAFETPWYIDGLGGFLIEDQVLITETGCEVMAPLPRDLMRVS